jgi:hypothetical protein
VEWSTSHRDKGVIQLTLSSAHALQIELIKRCIDGELNGALPPCPQAGCKGRLKLDTTNKTGETRVSCSGAFDDELGTFVRCYFKANADTVTRVPWRESPKSEEEIVEESKFQSIVDTSSADSLFDGIDISTIEGKKECTNRFVELARSEGINIPDTETEARIKLGTILLNNPTLTGSELLIQAEEMFGTLKGSSDKLEQSKVGTVNEENGR